MTKTCAVACCNTNHKKRIDGKAVITNPGTVFNFPTEGGKDDLLRLWLRFCNRKDKIKITNNIGICEKHFDEELIKYGSRKTLRWALDPAPTKYPANIDVPPSVLPTPSSRRKPPTQHSVYTESCPLFPSIVLYLSPGIQIAPRTVPFPINNLPKEIESGRSRRAESD